MKPRVFSKLPVFVLGLLLLVAASSVAQPPGKRGPDPRERERIQSVIIGKFATEMDLKPEQAEQFFPRLRQFQDQVEVIQRDERQTRAEMDQLSQTPDGDREQLNNLLQRRKSHDQQMASLKEEFLSDITGFLTPQQVSRCSILLDDLPHQVRQFIREKERAKTQSSQPQNQRRGGALPRRRGY